MVILQRQQLTLEEFLELPECKPALEYACGTVTQKVSPKGPHGRLQFRLSRLCDSSDAPKRLAAAFPETRITFRGRSRVPDVAVYRWARIPRTPAGRVAENFTTPPDVVIEILSPGQSLVAHRRRCRWYVEHGIPIALLVNPRNDSIEHFRADREPALLVADDVVDLEDAVPGLRFTVHEVFASLWLHP